MIRALLATCLLFAFPVLSFAQLNQFVDVHLKDGSTIRGTIIERIPNQSITVQALSQTFNFKMSDIREITQILPGLDKDPVLAGILSAFVSGAGQMYNEEPIKAWGFFGIGVVGWLFALGYDEDLWVIKGKDRRQIGLIIVVVGNAISSGEAYQAAININHERAKAKRIYVSPISSRKRIGLQLAYRF